MKNNKNIKRKTNKKGPFSWILTNWFIALVQIATSILVSVSILKLDILTKKYLIAFFGALILGNLIYFALLFNNKKKLRSVGKVLSVLISLAMVVGSYQILNTNSFVGNITGGNVDSHVVSVLVLKDDKANKLKDLTGLEFGFNANVDKEYVDTTFTDINKKLKSEVARKEFTNNEDLVSALFDKKVRTILLSEGQRSLIEEVHPNFSEDTRIIHQNIIENKVDINTNKPGVNVMKDTFTIFISGIDTYGPVSSVSRSDVNMLMTVNPQTNQILLTSIPRDYFVTLGRIGVKDKLTHAGIYGIEESVTTLEKLFDINIDYFIKVNFSSLTKIVDALGGITVNSNYAFTSGAGQNIVEGVNQMNGKQTLAFVRERKKLPGGDNARILNQQAAITGIINKALTPAIILNYSSFLASIDGSFVLSMPEGDFKKLIRNQVDTMAPWQILNQAVSGTGKSSTSYSYPHRALYVSEPNMDTVRAAHNKIQAMERHERIGN